MKKIVMYALSVSLISALLVTGAACNDGGNGGGGNGGGTGGAIQKPYTFYLPTDWQQTADVPYGTYLDYGLYSGLVEYTDSWDGDFIQIFYGDIPATLASDPADSNALKARAEFEAIFTPDGTGIMYVAAQPAGYAEAYDASWDWWETEIVFVYGSTYVDIYAVYGGEQSDIDEALDIINSISF